LASDVIGRSTRGRSALLALLLVVSACAEARDAATGGFDPATEGTLTVATELPAPGFWDGDDVDSIDGGFEWALATAIAEELDVSLTIVSVPFADIVTGELGGADLSLTQITATSERAEVVDFTVPYFESAPTALARAGTQEDLVDLATAKEQQWAVHRSTTHEDYLDDIVRPDDEPLLFDTNDEVVQAVLDGEADVALLDLQTALIFAKQEGMVVPARFDQDESIAILLDEDSESFDAIDTALRKLLADGTVDRLREQWLEPAFSADPDDIPVISARS
jgi:polar amino acid transport system substrate-binding protein